MSLALATCGLTWLYLGMRSVMEIGGACAEGGPYEIATPCPDGVPLLMVGGIFLGLIATAAFVAFASKLGGAYGLIGALRVAGALPVARVELLGVRARPARAG